MLDDVLPQADVTPIATSTLPKHYHTQVVGLLASSPFRDLAAWSQEHFVGAGIMDAATRLGLLRADKNIGGSHTVVTAHPMDDFEPIEPQEVLKRLDRTPSSVHLYAHIAFCEYPCGFCHYSQTVGHVDSMNDDTSAYLRALHLEIGRWKDEMRPGGIGSIYIGGGTPTVLPTAELEGVLNALQSFAPNGPASVCIETSPQTLIAPGGDRKMAAMLRAGVTRVSMGAQSFDDRVLKKARNHTSDVVHTAVETLRGFGVPYNIDMIQGLPHQGEASLLNDLESIRRYMPPQVTWYIFRTHEGSPWHKVRERGGLPPQQDSPRLRLMIEEGMRRLGYQVQPGGRFCLPGVEDLGKKVRLGSEAAPSLGMGCAAYSRSADGSVQWKNEDRIDKREAATAYRQKIELGEWPVATGRMLTQEERLAAGIVAKIQSGTSIPDDGTPYTSRVLRRLNSLAAEGFAECDAGRWRIAGHGWLFAEEITSELYADSVRSRLHAKGRL